MTQKTEGLKSDFQFFGGLLIRKAEGLASDIQFVGGILCKAAAKSADVMTKCIRQPHIDLLTLERPAAGILSSDPKDCPNHVNGGPVELSQ